jgi:hypothetical protein
MSWQALIGRYENPAMPYATLVLVGCWLTLAGLAVRSLSSLPARWRTEQARTDLIAVVLVLVAIGLRLELAPATPEIRWRLLYAYAGLQGAGESEVWKYGLGFPLLVKITLPLFGRSYDAPFVLNAVLGGASVLPMIGLARSLGGSPITALWCGYALAVTPLHVWFSHTDGPLAADLLFALVTLWAVASYARQADPRWLVVAVCGVVSTAQMRVEAIGFGGFAVLLALALTPGFPWRRPAPWVALISAVLLLLPHGWLVYEPFLDELSRRRIGGSGEPGGVPLTHYVFLNPTMQARVLIVATVLGLLHHELRPAVKAWALLAMFVFGSVILENHPHQTAFTAARYQAHTLPFAALLSGFGMSWLASLTTGPAVPLALIFGAAVDLRIAATETLLLHEHDFFRDNLARVESPCTVMSWLSTGDTTLFPPTHLSALQGHQHTWLDIARAEPPSEGCVIYWKAGACTRHYEPKPEDDAVRYPVCATFEARWRMEPIAETSFAPDPYGPMGMAARFPNEPIPVGFYRIVGPAEIAPTPAGEPGVTGSSSDP